MTKIFAAVAIAAMLAGCASTPASNTLNIATGVDSRGNVIWERHNAAPVTAQSLSTRQSNATPFGRF